MTRLALTEDGTLTLGESALRYHSDGSFRNEAGNLMVQFVEAENGETYLWQKYYIQLPGLGELPGSSYVFQKLKENPVPEAVQAAWDARNGKIYLCLNEKYTSGAYWCCRRQDWPACRAIRPLTVSWMRTTPRAWRSSRRPAGRDHGQNVRLFEQDGWRDAQTLRHALRMDAGRRPGDLCRRGLHSTIQSDGCIRWYRTSGAPPERICRSRCRRAAAVLRCTTETVVTVAAWLPWMGIPR
ncbi:MAG: hypothetical protein ACLU9S_05495 [Oscillospiraceae bacterium]